MLLSVKNLNIYSKIPLKAGSFFWSLLLFIFLSNYYFVTYAGCCCSKKEITVHPAISLPSVLLVNTNENDQPKTTLIILNEQKPSFSSSKNTRMKKRMIVSIRSFETNN